MRVFPPSTVSHPWRGAWALLAAAFWWAVICYLLLYGAVWLLGLFGAPGWSFVPVTG